MKFVKLIALVFQLILAVARQIKELRAENKKVDLSGKLHISGLEVTKTGDSQLGISIQMNLSTHIPIPDGIADGTNLLADADRQTLLSKYEKVDFNFSDKNA